MELIEPAARAAGAPSQYPTQSDYLAGLEQASIRHTMKNLMTFPCIRICVERGKLALYGAYFDVATGRLSVLDGTDGNFRTLGREGHTSGLPAER